jgi:hypothetical protein
LHEKGLNGQWFDNTKLQTVACPCNVCTNELGEIIGELIRSSVMDNELPPDHPLISSIHPRQQQFNWPKLRFEN